MADCLRKLRLSFGLSRLDNDRGMRKTEIGSHLTEKPLGSHTQQKKIYKKDKMNMQKYGKDPWKRKQGCRFPIERKSGLDGLRQLSLP